MEQAIVTHGHGDHAHLGDVRGQPHAEGQRVVVRFRQLKAKRGFILARREGALEPRAYAIDRFEAHVGHAVLSFEGFEAFGQLHHHVFRNPGDLAHVEHAKQRFELKHVIAGFDVQVAAHAELRLLDLRGRRVHVQDHALTHVLP